MKHYLAESGERLRYGNGERIQATQDTDALPVSAESLMIAIYAFLRGL